MFINRHTAAVINNSKGAVLHDRDFDMGAVPCKSFVDRVVHDFVYEVVQAALTCRSDVHAGTFANGIEAFKDLDGAGVVGRLL
jgi:hypothetical protein